MENPLTTDEILDVYLHLEKTGKTMPELLAEHGVQDMQMRRATSVLVRSGEERVNAFSIGLAIGLQLGAMRLPPVEYVPTPESEDEPKCNCIICQLLGEGNHDD